MAKKKSLELDDPGFTFVEYMLSWGEVHRQTFDLLLNESFIQNDEREHRWECFIVILKLAMLRGMMAATDIVSVEKEQRPEVADVVEETLNTLLHSVEEPLECIFPEFSPYKDLIDKAFEFTIYYGINAGIDDMIKKREKENGKNRKN